MRITKRIKIKIRSTSKIPRESYPTLTRNPAPNPLPNRTLHLHLTLSLLFFAGSFSCPVVAADPPKKRPAIGIGVAITPRNFPKHTIKDMLDAFHTAKELGDYSVSITQWSHFDIARTKQFVEISRKHKLTSLIALSPTTLDQRRKELDVPGPVRKKAGQNLSFDNADVREAFKKSAAELAALKLPYLCLATEINFLIQRPQEYVRFASLYKEAYKEVKKVSPDTKVFVSFQWDIFQNAMRREGRKPDELRKLVDIFRPELDVVCITSYPADIFETPAKMPGDYYSAVKAFCNQGDEVCVMELGWGAAGKGTEQEQTDFIMSLPTLFREVEPSVIAWALLHDVNVFDPTINSTGLITREGKRRAGFEALKRLKSAGAE